MAIVQISKLQQRAGNLVDLPQLDEAEFGFATDAKLLFVGKESPAENIEVLTSYSNISFSQINGSGGNLNIDSANLANGQVLAYTGTEWTNKGGTLGGLITLGDVANVRITGGAGGYVLTTDGVGNLSFNPQGTLYTNILAISSASTGIMTVANTTPYTNGQSITVSGVLGANANAVINGQTLYVQLAVDFATTGNVSLYTDSGLTTGLNTTTLTATPNTGIATAVLSGGGTGSIGAGGSPTQVQFNDGGTLNGSSSLTWSSPTLTVVSNIAVGNISATGTIAASTLVSSIATGTAPLTVTSTTRVANLNVSAANVSDFSSVTLQTSGTFYPTFVSSSATGNRALGANASLVFNAATGNLSATILNATGNVSGANLTTAGVVTATGNVSGGNITTAGVVSATGNVSGGNITTAGVVSATGNVSGGNIVTSNNVSGTTLTGTLTTAAQPNVTSVSSSFTSLTFANAQTISGNNLSITTGANTNLGSITGNWTLTTGSRLQATYADLAEYYSADDYYQPGTVLEFGGSYEVTLAKDGTNKVAGVVSTDPAYAMNAKCPGMAVALALQGRVPCKVRGKVEKGDMMISAGDGFARACINPTIGSVIGKSLENFNGTEGFVEVAVGRL
jgi:hypothetical protein